MELASYSESHSGPQKNGKRFFNLLVIGQKGILSKSVYIFDTLVLTPHPPLRAKPVHWGFIRS